jgi:outer membrane protein OmpA-like peptidoglycan-associated protein
LLGKNSLETYYHILNVIGKRLKEHPEATITLTGCNNNQGKEKNNKNLSTQRAETVKNYLLNVWQISPDKIKTIGRNLPDKFSNPKDPDGIAENQRVELSSDTWEILEPIMIEDVVKKINPADITVKQTIKSPKPINNYKFNANTSQGDLSGIDVAVPESDEVKIHIDLNKMHNVNDTLKAYVELENEDEYVITPVNKIPIEVIEKDISLNLYNLILFDFNSAELGKANSKIAEFINNDLEPDAQVKVIGYTDRIGETDHNAKLSTNRANSTSKSLKSKNIEAIGVGENELLYDNDSPEGRFYCRTVQVQVQQKNK